MQLAKVEHLGSHVLYTFAVVAASGGGQPPPPAHSFAVRYSEARAKHFQLVEAGLVDVSTGISFPPRNVFSDMMHDDGAVLTRGEVGHGLQLQSLWRKLLQL